MAFNKLLYGFVAAGFLLMSSSASPVSEFDQWKQQQQQSFQEYRDERDREFTAFLKEHWREMELLKGVVRDKEPKPVTMPVAKPMPIEPAPEELPVKKPVEDKPVEILQPDPDIEPAPPVPVRPAPVPEQVRKGLRVRLDYFGTPVTFYYDPALKKSLAFRLNESALSKFWSGLSKADYESLLEQMDKQAKALQLNDWGYALLTNKLGERIYPGDKNRQALFTWFVLTKAGFKSRVAYDDRSVYLLIPSKQRMYEVTYFTFDNERYYAVSFDGRTKKPGRVYTYDGHYPGAANKLDMTIRNRVAKGENVEKRDLSFDYGGKEYAIDADYEKARINYLNTYPQMDLALYFNSAVAEVAESPLLQQLANAMEGMNETEAVNFLLRFVQTSFGYKTDDVQFGRENYLFPEETIFYPYSDCEDRSVLFAWLVRRLLSLDVVGLNYPGHVATAVRLNNSDGGDYIIHDGKRYTVADPTFINATVGMTMPEFKSSRPEVVLIR
jgi:hypothetical protein